MDSHYTALPAIVKLFVVNMVTAIVLTIGIKNTRYSQNHHIGKYGRPNILFDMETGFRIFPFVSPARLYKTT